MRCSPAEKRDPAESEVPKCPEDCVYRKLINGSHWPTCEYLLMANEMRGCEPGPGCKRYVGQVDRIRGYKHRKPIWDVEAGKKLWEEGYTDGQIASTLGAKRQTVSEYRKRNWGEINRQRQKRK